MKLFFIFIFFAFSKTGKRTVRRLIQKSVYFMVSILLECRTYASQVSCWSINVDKPDRLLSLDQIFPN